MGGMVDIADRIREARTKRNLSARALARAAGLSENYISLIESRAKGTDLGLGSRTLERVAKVLDVSIDWLVTGETTDRGAPESLPPATPT